MLNVDVDVGARRFGGRRARVAAGELAARRAGTIIASGHVEGARGIARVVARALDDAGDIVGALSR